jgi:hemolysin III
MSVAVMPEVRPTWRGWMHTAAFVAAIPGGVLLLARADHAAARVATAIYGVSLLLGFGTSAAYHRLARSERAVQIMQRLDHSMIYVLIAGSYTPVCLLAMPTAWAVPMLSVVWGGAVLGIVIKLFAFERLKLLGYCLYPVLGWAAVISLPALLDGMSSAELVLLFSGGILYTVGIPVLVRERPNPWPRTFGYHEVWHAFTVAAGACHFAAIGLLVG